MVPVLGPVSIRLSPAVSVAWLCNIPDSGALKMSPPVPAKVS